MMKEYHHQRHHCHHHPYDHHHHHHHHYHNFLVHIFFITILIFTPCFILVFACKIILLEKPCCGFSKRYVMLVQVFNIFWKCHMSIITPYVLKQLTTIRTFGAICTLVGFKDLKESDFVPLIVFTFNIL